MDCAMQALADPIRREILRKVRAAPLTAGAIAAAFTVSRPAVSRHLRVLREAGLVAVEESGRERVYRLQLAPLPQIEAFLAELRDPKAALQSAWERKFMTLETEVYRVRTRRKSARTKPAQDHQQDSTQDNKRRTG
jgi:DNA-binding transcriptional ArsR family regulator